MESPPLPRPLILGSTSRYRHELLSRLGLPFQVAAPDVDETPRAGETPRTLALRLARAKAHAVAQTHPQALVLGSDQVADLNGTPLGFLLFSAMIRVPCGLFAKLVRTPAHGSRSLSYHALVRSAVLLLDVGHLTGSGRSLVLLVP